MGRDMIVPPHTAWRAVPGCCVAWGERRGVWGARRVLTRARTRRDGGEGSRVGRTVVAWLGAGARTLGAYNPYPGNRGVALTPFAVPGDSAP